MCLFGLELYIFRADWSKMMDLVVKGLKHLLPILKGCFNPEGFVIWFLYKFEQMAISKFLPWCILGKSIGGYLPFNPFWLWKTFYSFLFPVQWTPFEVYKTIPCIKKHKKPNMLIMGNQYNNVLLLRAVVGGCHSQGHSFWAFQLRWTKLLSKNFDWMGIGK